MSKFSETSMGIGKFLDYLGCVISVLYIFINLKWYILNSNECLPSVSPSFLPLSFFNPITVLVMLVTLTWHPRLGWSQKSLTSKKVSLEFSGSDSVVENNSKENKRLDCRGRASQTYHWANNSQVFQIAAKRTGVGLKGGH